MKLFILGAGLSKSTATGTLQSQTIGYRACETEEEAIGSFVKEIPKNKPGFLIVDIACHVVPAEHIAALSVKRPVSIEDTPPDERSCANCEAGPVSCQQSGLKCQDWTPQTSINSDQKK